MIDTVTSLFRCCDFFIYYYMCGFILYIFIYISQIFRTASPFLKTQEKQTKTKSSIAVYTTKETEKETSTTYCTI